MKIKLKSSLFLSASVLSLFVCMLYANIKFADVSIDSLSDLGNYYDFFLYSSHQPSPVFSYDYGFSIFTWVFSKFLNFNSFLGLFLFFVWLGLMVSVRPFSNNVLLLSITSFIFLFYFPVYQSLTVLVLRQGISSAWALLCLPSFFRGFSGNKIWIGFSCLLIILFHGSGVFFVISAFLAFVFGVRLILLIWFIVCLLYIFGISGDVGFLLLNHFGFDPDIFRSLATERIDIEYTFGFKLNFFLLSLAPVVFYLFGLYLKSVAPLFYSDYLNFLFVTYLTLNILGMFSSSLMFHDRIFIWSWILIPPLMLGFVFSYRFVK